MKKISVVFPLYNEEKRLILVNELANLQGTYFKTSSYSKKQELKNKIKLKMMEIIIMIFIHMHKL